MMKKLSQEAIGAWGRLIQVQQRLLDKVEADLKGAGLPPLSWYDVLLELNRVPAGRLRQFELSEKVLLSKYNLSRLLDRLEEQGLIGRESCDEDRRGTHVSITPDGKKLLKRMWPIYAKAIHTHFARHLAPEEQAQLGALLERLLH
ncbi:MAG: MarR family transcriptional regulator [Pseudomonadota bacterium]